MRRHLALFVMSMVLVPAAAWADQQASSAENASRRSRGATFLSVVAGGAAGLVIHESSHLFFDVAFDAKPGVKKVSFHGIPFFAITHRSDLSPRREFTVSSAGFWSQHALTEWLLTRRPDLRREQAPVAKGVLAFSILTSAAYSGAAFARTGPEERDTRGMSSSLGVDERWIGLLVLVPAVLDSYRYFRPGTGWATWSSRAAKTGMVLLVLK